MPEEDLMISRMKWKVLACPKRMCRWGINGEGESSGNWLALLVHVENWPLKWCVCVRVCILLVVFYAVEFQRCTDGSYCSDFISW